MGEIFLNVLMQVLILFVLIALGFIAAKTKILNAAASKGITSFVLTLVMPCVLIKSFADKALSSDSLKMFLKSFLWAIALHLLFILFATLLVRTKNISDRKILQFGVVFSNCGFMSIPLQQAILGDDGVFYAASFIAVMNLALWSYGAFTVSGDKKYLISYKAIINPSAIGFIIGLSIFLLSLPLQKFKLLYEPVSYLAALNTPLPMVLIGFHLASSDVFKAFKSLPCLFATLLRLIVLPLAAIGIMYLCGIRGDLLISLAISASAPVAAATTMFAEKFDGNTALSANFVSISTLLSLITMPIMVAFASFIA